MTRLRFEGRGNGIMGEYEFSHVEHDNGGSGEPIHFQVNIPGHTDGMIVVGRYAPGRANSWLIGISSFDMAATGESIPDWPTRFEQGGNSESPVLFIEAPDGIEVHCLER